MLSNVFHVLLGFMSNLECAHSIPFLVIFIVFFFFLLSIMFYVLSYCHCQFPFLSFSPLVSPHSFCFSYICTYVSTQPKILSNSKASSSRLKGGARSGASFHDLDQCVFPYSFFYKIIHILLHNKILLSYRLRSWCNVVPTCTAMNYYKGLCWFISSDCCFRFCVQAIHTIDSIYTQTQLWDKLKFKHHVPMETSQTFDHFLSGIKYSWHKRLHVQKSLYPEGSLTLVLLMAVCPVQNVKTSRKASYMGLVFTLALNYCHGGNFPP